MAENVQRYLFRIAFVSWVALRVPQCLREYLCPCAYPWHHRPPPLTTVRYRTQSLFEMDVFHWASLARYAARPQECLPCLDVPAVVADGQCLLVLHNHCTRSITSTVQYITGRQNRQITQNMT